MSGKSTKTKGVTKVTQSLGPTSFMLDGMPAILGALLEENDVESRIGARASEFSIPGGGGDGCGDITRSCVCSDNEADELLTRTLAVDRLNVYN
jgi:origin recognition complex subunit 5